MTTKQIRAGRLTTGHTLVLGGDGKPRTTHELCEVGTTTRSVEVRFAGSFELRTFEPTEKVRVLA